MKKITKISLLALMASALLMGCTPASGDTNTTDTSNTDTTKTDTTNSSDTTPVKTDKTDSTDKKDSADKTNTTNKTDSTQKPTDEKPADTKPAETVILSLDFSAISTAKIEDSGADLYYCNAGADKIEEGALKLDVSQSWDGAFKLSHAEKDVTGAKFEIVYKVSSDWEYKTADGKKCLVQFVSEDGTEANSYKPYAMSQAEFEQKDAARSTDYTTVTLNCDDFYGNNWDVDKKDGVAAANADLSKVLVTRINTTDAVGTIWIKSIKIYK